MKASTPEPLSILLLSPTTPTSYRHASIPAGIRALTRLCESHGFALTATEDIESLFRDPQSDPLAPFSVLLLLHCAGDFLPPPPSPARAALQAFLHRGGGIVAIHGASTGMPSWPWYGAMLGGVFKHHPPPSKETVRIVNPTHPIMAAWLDKDNGMRRLDDGTWERDWFDEWYEFERDPRGEEGVEVLMAGGGQGEGYPVAWCRESFEGGRVFYTALGHFDEAYEDGGFMAQVLGAVLWTARK